MFEPVRGGTRGGQAQFKWSDVAADKDREHYLGHSINAPTGRWQKNKDIHWYNREEAQTQAERDEEIRKVKEAEAEALAVALGFAPSSNSQPLASSESAPNLIPDDATGREEEERKRRKAERKESKRARKQEKKAGRDQDRPRDRTRSPPRSPPHRKRDTEGRYTRRSRSRSPSDRVKRADRMRDYDSVGRGYDRPRDGRLSSAIRTASTSLCTVQNPPFVRIRSSFPTAPSTALHVLFIRSDVLPRVSFRGLVSFRSTFSNSTPLPRASHCLLVSSQQIEDRF